MPSEMPATVLVLIAFGVIGAAIVYSRNRRGK